VAADLAGAWVAVAGGVASCVGTAGVAGLAFGVGVGVGTPALAVGFGAAGFAAAGLAAPVLEAVVVVCARSLVFGLVSCLTSAGRARSAIGVFVRRTPSGVTARRADRRVVFAAVERAFSDAALVTSAVAAW